MTQEVIADIANLQSVNHISELGQGDGRELGLSVAKEKGSGAE